MVDIKIGADPEFFLRDKNTGKHVSAHGIVPGTKKEPHKVDGGAVQLDGTAVEFNIDPASSAFEFCNHVSAVLKQLREMVPDHLEFVYAPAILYDLKYFAKIPEVHKELGCDPDYSAESNNPFVPNPPPPVEFVPPGMRTGAGHLHIGFTNTNNPTDVSHMTDCVLLIQNMNKLYSSLRYNWDNDHSRSSLYGGSGAFRPKAYGVEYRTPSNAWLNFPRLWGWLFELSREVVYRTMDDDRLFKECFRMSFKTYNDWAALKKLPRVPDNWKEAA